MVIFYLQGNTEQHQITLIAQLCGTITTEVWEGVDRLELFNKMEIPKVTKNKTFLIFPLCK
jgi:cyclin-dependent kinase 9